MRTTLNSHELLRRLGVKGPEALQRFEIFPALQPVAHVVDVSGLVPPLVGPRAIGGQTVAGVAGQYGTMQLRVDDPGGARVCVTWIGGLGGGRVRVTLGQADLGLSAVTLEQYGEGTARSRFTAGATATQLGTAVYYSSSINTFYQPQHPVDLFLKSGELLSLQSETVNTRWDWSVKVDGFDQPQTQA